MKTKDITKEIEDKVVSMYKDGKSYEIIKYAIIYTKTNSFYQENMKNLWKYRGKLLNFERLRVTVTRRG